MTSIEHKDRESNIELLRIVLMAIIIVWHCLVYGEHFLQNLQKPALYIAPLLVFPVDCFVFISGYYGLKLNRKKMIALLGMLVTYSLAIYLITTAINGKITQKDLVISLFPVSTNYWWFFTAYVMLIIISPMLNVCETWEKPYFKKILILFSIFYLGLFSLAFGTKMGCIGDLTLFIFIYLLGRYLRKFPIKQLISHSRRIFVMLYLTSILLIHICHNDHQSIIKLISYNNPIVVLTATTVFFTFKQINIGHIKPINSISKTVFASYIITESILRNTYITAITQIGNGIIWYAIASITTILLIYPIEWGRSMLSYKLLEWIRNKSYKFIR